MKFKIAVIGLLTIIATTCIFTAYKLTTEAEKQTQLQIAQTEAAFGTYEYVHDIATGKNEAYKNSDIWEGSGSGWMVYAEPTFREAAKFGIEYK